MNKRINTKSQTDNRFSVCSLEMAMMAALLAIGCCVELMNKRTKRGRPPRGRTTKARREEKE